MEGIRRCKKVFNFPTSHTHVRLHHPKGAIFKFTCQCHERTLVSLISVYACQTWRTALILMQKSDAARLGQENPHLVDAAKAFEGRLNVGKFQYDVANHRAAYEGGLSCRLLVTHLDFYIYGLEVFLSINVSHVEVPVVTLNLLARRRKIYSMGLNGNKCDSPRYVQK